MTAYENMRQLLASCKLEAVAHKRENTLQTVAASLPVADALKMMAHAQVLSVPVTDDKTDEFCGVFSVSDALRHLVKALKLENGNHDLSQTEVTAAMKQLHSSRVDKLMHNGDLWYVHSSNKGVAEPTVMDAVRDMLTDTTIHHRLFTCASLKDTRPTGILSQSDIVQMMWDHKVEFGDLLKSSVEELGLCSSAAETVPATETTIQVLLDMFRDHKSCMGITASPGGALVGNLSASDIRFITPSMFPKLTAPVGEFILAMRNLEAPQGTNVDWQAALASVPVVTVEPQTTLEVVLQKLATTKVHRLYVPDAVEGSLSIITLTDILRPLMPAPSAAPTEGPAGGLPMGEGEEMEAMQEGVTAM